MNKAQLKRLERNNSISVYVGGGLGLVLSYYINTWFHFNPWIVYPIVVMMSIGMCKGKLDKQEAINQQAYGGE